MTQRPRHGLGRLAGLVLAATTMTILAIPAGALAASSATDGASTTACSGGAWPAAVQGAQTVGAGSAAGDHLWHDATGWHLRVTHAATTKAVFSGTIHANRPLHVRGYHLETGDSFTLSADRLTVTYRLVNYGKLDGLDFATDCATRLSIGGRLNGVLLPVRRIWVGHAGVHPLQNPFVILRRA